MSTALAVAATTRVLGSLLEKSISDAGVQPLIGSVPPYFTEAAPDQIEAAGGGTEDARLALFLYHVTYNQGWREERLPSRNSAGQVIDRPPLAIDLHYLLVGYGQSDYAQHLLLGIGMQTLHEAPVIYRQQIVNLFTPPPPLSALDTALASAGLDSQLEQIKITPEALTTDDLSKLWTAFGSKFRPSAGFLATTLLIESTAAVAAAPPVMSRNVAVVQLRRPAVSAVTPYYLPWATNLSLTLTGVNLSGAGVCVVFDRAPQAPQIPHRVDATTSTVSVPPITAGLNSLHVVQQVAVGAPPAKNVVQSDAAMFYLQPVIRRKTTGTKDELITVGPVQAGTNPPTRTVTVQLDPALDPTQSVQLLLDELAPPAGTSPLSFTFDARPDQIATNSVGFDIYDTRAGSYLVRVRVDGAESLLRTDPVTLDFAKPAVTL